MTQHAALSTPFPEMVLQKLAKGGTSLTYIPISEVIARLNKVLGPRWSHEVLECRQQDGFVLAHVRLSATVDDHESHHEAWGGAEIKTKKSGGLLDLGHDYKGAVSDALKKAAQAFGVALDLARKDEAIQAEHDAEPITDEQRERVKALCADKDLDLSDVLERGGIASLDDLTRARAQRVIDYLNSVVPERSDPTPPSKPAPADPAVTAQLMATIKALGLETEVALKAYGKTSVKHLSPQQQRDLLDELTKRATPTKKVRHDRTGEKEEVS